MLSWAGVALQGGQARSLYETAFSPPPPPSLTDSGLQAQGANGTEKFLMPMARGKCSVSGHLYGCKSGIIV